MSVKRIIDHLTLVHKSDDKVVTANRVLSELYEMKGYHDTKEIRKAISKMINYIDKQVNKTKN
jgi:hypothetical protein